MPEYLAPGVYVEEVDRGPRPIEGVSTSTAGFVGVTERGRVGWPTLVTSFPDFTRKFGQRLRPADHPDAWYLPLAVEGFFANGGKRVYVVRALPDTATTAGTALYDRGETLVVFDQELVTRADEDDGFLIVDDDSDIGAGEWLTIADGATTEYLQVAPAAAGVVALHHPLAADVAAGDAINVYPAGPGADRDLTTAVAAAATQLELSTIAGLAAGDFLRIVDGPRTEICEFTGSSAPNIADLAAGVRFAHVDTATDATVVVQRLALAPLPVAAGSTTAVVAADAGSHLITLADDSVLTSTGDPVIGVGAVPTTFYAFDDPSVEEIADPIRFTHGTGSLVTTVTLAIDGTVTPSTTADAEAGDEELTVDDRTGLAAGDVFQLAGTPNEYVIIDASYVGSLTSAGEIPLSAPLAADFAAGAISRRTVTAVNTTPLVRAVRPGDSAIVLNQNLVAPAVLAFGTGVTLEYHELVGGSTNEIVPLANAAADGHVVGTTIAGRSAVVQVAAIDPGDWGDCLRVTASSDSILEAARPTPENAGAPTLVLDTAVGVEAGTVLEFYRTTAGAPPFEFRQKVIGRAGNTVSFAAAGAQGSAQNLDGNGDVVNLTPAGLAFNVTADMRVRTREFALTVECIRTSAETGRQYSDPAMFESFRNLSMDPRHSRYAGTVIGEVPPPGERTDGESRAIRIADPWAATAWTGPSPEDQIRLGPDAFQQTVNGITSWVGFQLDGGSDDIGNLVDADYEGTGAVDPDDRTGLHALRNIENVSIVAIPGRTSPSLQQDIINHCELMRYRFAVLDPPEESSLDEVQTHRNLYDTRYAALYYPWLTIPDPFPTNPAVPQRLEIPPSGHTAGIYARTDITRGVHKAPANEVVRDITGLEFTLTKGEHDILNPRNINVTRDFREQGRGIRIWGARCTTSDSSWKYVNVRRLFLFLEHSIDRGTQWVVFEPNDHRTWARVRQSVANFLTTVWRSGALMGRTPEEAFFVKCDAETMTQDDIDNGRLIMLIGVAPVKPAEFVIIRIGQWSAGSSVEEF